MYIYMYIYISQSHKALHIHTALVNTIASYSFEQQQERQVFPSHGRVSMLDVLYESVLCRVAGKRTS